MVKLALGRDDTNPMHAGASWRLQALKTTATELGHPILFSKAIIITAFLPIFTFQRVEGRIFTPVTYTVSFALLGAILLTMTLVPTLLAYAVRGESMAEKHSAWMHALQEHYRSLIKWTMSRKRFVLVLSAIPLALSLIGAPMLGSEFLPKLDEGNIWLTISLPPSTALERTKEIERDVRAVLRSYPEIHNVVTQVGRPDDGTDPKGPNNLEMLADLQPREKIGRAHV